MPDTNINVRITGTDDLTPKFNQVTNAMREMDAAAKKMSGGGGGGGEAGGMMEKMSEQGKELMAGIGYNIGLWNVGMMASQAVLNALGDAFKEFNAEIQLATQWENRLDQSNIQSTQSFDRLREAALLSGTALTDTAKRVQEFTSLGMGLPQAITTTQVIQQRLKETGVDVGEVVKKAQTLSATAQDVMKAGEAGGPFAFLKPQAESLARMEATRPYDELQMHRRQLGGERELQDTGRIIERASTERHRAIEYEMEDRFRAINREMELRHLAINQEMADRHRLAEQSAADQDRLLSRQTGVASGIKGVMEAALGLPISKDMASRMGAGMTQAVSAVRAQMEIGMKQLQKDLGIEPGVAKTLIQAGAMSPGVLLQEAQAAREEQRITEQRQRQNEEIQTGRNLQREAIQERRAQEDEQRDTQRGLAAEELAMQYAIQDKELELQRRNQDERINFEEKFTVLRYQLNKAVLDAQARDEEQRRIKEAVLHGQPQAPGLERASLGQPGTGANWLFPFNLLFGGTRRENLGPELVGKEPGPEQELNETVQELDKNFKDSGSETQVNTDATNQNSQIVKTLSTAVTNAGQIMEHLTQAISGGVAREAGGGGGGSGTAAGGGGVERYDYGPAGQQEIYLDKEGNIVGARAYGRHWTEAELTEQAARRQAFLRKKGGGGDLEPHESAVPIGALSPFAMGTWTPDQYPYPEQLMKQTMEQVRNYHFGVEGTPSPWAKPSAGAGFEEPTNQHTDPATEKTLASIAQSLNKILSTA